MKGGKEGGRGPGSGVKKGKEANGPDGKGVLKGGPTGYDDGLRNERERCPVPWGGSTQQGLP